MHKCFLTVIRKTKEERVEEAMKVVNRPQKSQPRETRAKNHQRGIGRSRKAGKSIVKMKELPTMVKINRNSQMETAQDYQELRLQAGLKMVVLS